MSLSVDIQVYVSVPMLSEGTRNGQNRWCGCPILEPRRGGQADGRGASPERAGSCNQPARGSVREARTRREEGWSDKLEPASLLV
jgi:hypothetical protein